MEKVKSWINKITKGKISAPFLLFIAGLVILNLLADVTYYRFDLTKEKRYTLAPSTIKLITKLDDVAFFTIYLDGNMTADYKRLREATRDMLNEFKMLAGSKIEFEFEDVLSDKDVKEKDEILRQLVSKGLEYIKPEVDADEAATEKILLPCGMVFYNGQEYPLNLLKKKFGNTDQRNIGEAIELLEYEIGNVIRKCIAGKESKIALIDGHGELTDIEVEDLAMELNDFYKVKRFNLNLNDSICRKQVAGSIPDSIIQKKSDILTIQYLVGALIKKLNTYKGIIIAKPRYRFQDFEKLIIDQYIMNGGKVIWLVESLNAEMDSMIGIPSFYTHDYDLNLSDLLFRYGCRVNLDLVQDMNCNVTRASLNGNYVFRPWIFYPLVNPADSLHPIVKNINSVWTQFTSSIDTTTNPKIKKTILLHSSDYSRTAGNPVNISLDIMGIKPNPAVFNKPYRPVAVLLEGNFKSMYEYIGRVKEGISFKNSIEKNSMIVISDGDMARNQLIQGRSMPLGFDKYASQFKKEPVIFANKKFLMNCVDYLCDESNLIEVRSKEVEIRLLNSARIKEEKLDWQLINMLGPIGTVLVFGFINGWWRRRKYAR